MHSFDAISYTSMFFAGNALNDKGMASSGRRPMPRVIAQGPSAPSRVLSAPKSSKTKPCEGVQAAGVIASAGQLPTIRPAVAPTSPQKSPSLPTSAPVLSHILPHARAGAPLRRVRTVPAKPSQSAPSPSAPTRLQQLPVGQVHSDVYSSLKLVGGLDTPGTIHRGELPPITPRSVHSLTKQCEAWKNAASSLTSTLNGMEASISRYLPAALRVCVCAIMLQYGFSTRMVPFRYCRSMLGVHCNLCTHKNSAITCPTGTSSQQLLSCLRVVPSGCLVAWNPGRIIHAHLLALCLTLCARQGYCSSARSRPPLGRAQSPSTPDLKS